MRRTVWKRLSDRQGRLRALSAWSFLQATREAQLLAGAGGSFGLCLNACVVARSLQVRGRQRFADGETLLRALDEPALYALTERYLAQFCEPSETETAEAVNPAFDTARYEELKKR